VEEEEDEENEKLNENLFRPVSDLELSVRSANCLQNAKITLIGELVQKSDAEMLKTKNFGRKSLNEIKAILEEMGLFLGMKLDDFPAPTVPDEEEEAKEEEGKEKEEIDRDENEESDREIEEKGEKGEGKTKKETLKGKKGEKKGKGKDK